MYQFRSGSVKTQCKNSTEYFTVTPNHYYHFNSSMCAAK